MGAAALRKRVGTALERANMGFEKDFGHLLLLGMVCVTVMLKSKQDIVKELIVSAHR